MEVRVESIQIAKKHVEKINLFNDNGMEVECLSLGGIITKIKVPNRNGKNENIVLAYKNLEDYIENPIYLGAIIGRTAGRIANGKVTINGQVYELGKTLGQHGHTLHGGVNGLDKKIWEVEVFEKSNSVGVHFHCKSEDGEEGYPGCVHITVTYMLREDNVFEISYYGISNKDTLLNLTNHSYFNLSGDGREQINEHTLYVDSNQVTELDDENIATGKLISVDQERCVDFREAKKIGQDIDHEYIKAQRGYDHAWKLNKGDGKDSIWIKDEKSGRRMSITTNQDSVVMYSLNFPQAIIMEDDQEMKYRGAVCFETQSLPIGYDEVFKEYSLLRAGEAYKAFTSFKFTIE